MINMQLWLVDLRVRHLWFIHFTGGGVIKVRFMDAVDNRFIVSLLGIVPWSSIC